MRDPVSKGLNMNKLELYQAYADKVAAKLGVTDKVIIQWAGKGGIDLITYTFKQDGCKIGKYTHAHCHVIDGEFPRGTICLSRSYFAKFSIKEWHHCIAHEVTHLAGKSNHGTPTFDRKMVALGVANDRERLNARSARKGHHHLWMSGRDRQGYFCECRVCHKREYKDY